MAAKLLQLTMLGTFLLSASPPGTQGQPPNYFYIQKYVAGGFLLHFDTEANHRYDLQWSTNALNQTGGPVQWTTFYTAEATPFQNHFILLDQNKTNDVRCYRLVTDP